MTNTPTKAFVVPAFIVVLGVNSVDAAEAAADHIARETNYTLRARTGPRRVLLLDEALPTKETTYDGEWPHTYTDIENPS